MIAHITGVPPRYTARYAKKAVRHEFVSVSTSTTEHQGAGEGGAPPKKCIIHFGPRSTLPDRPTLDLIHCPSVSSPILIHQGYSKGIPAGDPPPGAGGMPRVDPRQHQACLPPDSNKRDSLAGPTQIPFVGFVGYSLRQLDDAIG